MIKRLIKRILYRERFSSDSYVTFLRNKGIEIGEDVEIFNPRNTLIDVQYPWMIKIGNHVRITDGVIILTHDFSWSVIKNYPGSLGGEILGASGKVWIGNNVFIGMNSIITRGVEIGDNVIIGVGSVVTSDCESGYVYAGVPAKKIMSLEEYIAKRKKLQLEEAKELAIAYKKVYNSIPPIEVFFEYFMLFMTIDEAKCNVIFEKQLNVGQSYEETKLFYKDNPPLFSSYEDFLKWCYK